MRIAIAVVALAGLLVWEAWSERVRHRIALLLERLPALLVQITVDMTAWQLAIVKMAEETAEAARHLEHWRTREVSAAGYARQSQHQAGNAIGIDMAWSSPSGGWSLMILGEGMSWTQAPDDSWIDSYSGQGEELERLEQVIEEQRERIGEIR